MIVSQFLMLIAVALILMAWISAWKLGHRAPALQKIFVSLLLQSLAAVLLSFSGESLLFSLTLAACILGAVGWMVQSAGRLKHA